MGVSVIVAEAVGDESPEAAVNLAEAVPAAEVTIKFISVVGVGCPALREEQPAKMKTASKKHRDFLFIFNISLQLIRALVVVQK
jgi:hypothetical protein